MEYLIIWWAAQMISLHHCHRPFIVFIRHHYHYPQPSQFSAIIIILINLMPVASTIRGPWAHSASPTLSTSMSNVSSVMFPKSWFEHKFTIIWASLIWSRYPGFWTKSSELKELGKVENYGVGHHWDYEVPGSIFVPAIHRVTKDQRLYEHDDSEIDQW